MGACPPSGVGRTAGQAAVGVLFTGTGQTSERPLAEPCSLDGRPSHRDASRPSSRGLSSIACQAPGSSLTPCENRGDSCRQRPRGGGPPTHDPQAFLSLRLDLIHPPKIFPKHHLMIPTSVGLGTSAPGKWSWLHFLDEPSSQRDALGGLPCDRRSLMGPS